MKVAIIVFSPAGSTLKVARMLAQSLEARELEMQVLDITRQAGFFRGEGRRRYLEENVEPHDVLCIGGPVYAHHLHFNVLDLIRLLPEPGSSWGKPAMPFVTYGGITSGQALFESARALRASGRIPFLAMKINSFHSVSREFGAKINEGLPDEEVRPILEEAAGRVAGLQSSPTEVGDITSSLCYQSAASRLKDFLLFREKMINRLLQARARFHRGRCRSCGKCVKACPVQRLGLTDSEPMHEQYDIECIHCGECFFACRFGAIDRSMKLFEQPLLAGAAGKGFLTSREEPKSALYPLQAERVWAGDRSGRGRSAVSERLLR